ncbi:MAG: hypothetical protein A2172_02055 [Candidatus Woykebacteria bacterium RBG_13_40_15]|uniref:Uncharacterized protein n=1 Tax=Candidatus Woykebacteria bacterium RBG_13_40_15 TaxID=1802593 RepID=A0A1G1W692_9BACT|nr:MAG: hypothetical protein A2172_02055 [Candidatus Woykebacteria bacterium RBG_13_40_15]
MDGEIEGPSPEEMGLKQEDLKTERSNGLNVHEKQIDVEVLKGVHEKCTREYDDKYRSGLFGVNVELEEREIAEVENLIGRAHATLDRFIRDEPLYGKFESLVQRMRDSLGTFGEEGRLIEDPSATDISKAFTDKMVPALKVPSRIYNLYLWSNKVSNVQETLQRYQSSLAEGTTAKFFGRNVKDLYRLIKESGNETTSDETLEASSKEETT